MSKKGNKNVVKIPELEKRLDTKLAKKVDFLVQLLKIESISGEEYLVRDILVDRLQDLGFETSIDGIGNISAIRGQAEKYPLLNAHMDIVDISYGYYGKYGKYGSYYSSYYTKDNKTSGTTKSDKNGYLKDYDSDEIKAYLSNYIDIEEDDDDDDDYLDPQEALLPREEKTYSYGSVLSDVAFDTYINMTDSEKKRYFICSDCENYKNCEFTKNHLCKLFDLDEENLEAVAVMEAIAYGEEIAYTEENYEVYIEGGKIKGRGKERVLGGDDKCGVFIALEVARILSNMPMKILFTVQEEVGCVGIDYFVKHNQNWFDDVAYSLTIDRRDGDNLLWSQLGKRSCDNAFASRLALAGIQCGIPVKVQDGSVADVVTIRDYVPNAVNMSAGYHSPHSEDEYIVISELLSILSWVASFVAEESLE